MAAAGMVLQDRYRLEAPAGAGGMGAVWLAEDQRLPGRRCAIKILKTPAEADGADRAALRQAFLAEAAVLARLDHPSLPQVSDFFEQADSLCLVMDFVPGQDLEAVLADALSRGRRLEETQVVAWAEAACGALGYLHRQQPPICHRDVKPANLKLTPDGRLRLVDFGLAGATQAVDGRTVTVLAGAGSRPYQPLEQYGEGRRVDARSDLYALGATLYQLLTGRQPPSAQERFLQVGLLEPPRRLRPGLSERVEAAILSAMALHPDERPATAEAFRALLVGADPAPTGAWSTALRANAGLITLVLALLFAALALTAW